MRWWLLAFVKRQIVISALALSFLSSLFLSSLFSLLFSLFSKKKKTKHLAPSHVPPVTPSSLETFAFFSSISAAAAANEVPSLWETSEALSCIPWALS